MLSMSDWPKLNGRLSVTYAAKVHANAPQSLPFSCIAFRRRRAQPRRGQRARRIRIVTGKSFARVEPADDVHGNRFGSVRLELGQDGTSSSHVPFTRTRPMFTSNPRTRSMQWSISQERVRFGSLANIDDMTSTSTFDSPN